MAEDAAGADHTGEAAHAGEAAPAGTRAPAGSGYVDVHAFFGPDHGTAGTAGAPLDALVAERAAHGVRVSLASSLVARWADATIGNELAVEAAADPANGVRAIAVVGARRTGAAERAVAASERAGVVGYRLEGWNGTTALPESIHEVLVAVGRTGRPLLVAIGGNGAATRIGEATDALGIPVVLLGAHYMHIVDDLAAATRYPHLHLETSAMAHFRAVETAVRAIGSERVLLGTGSPTRAAASPIGAILAAAIGDDAKRAILAGNAIRLFDLPDGPVNLASAPGPVRAFDVHAHFGPFDHDVPQVDDVQLLDALRVPQRSTATTEGVASAALAIFGDPVRGNAQAARAVTDGSRDGLFAYVVADPSDLDSTRDQLHRYLDAPGFIGVKVHGEWSATPTASPAMSDLFDLLATFGRPVKIHNAGEGWDGALGAIARRHPRLPIIVAHGGLGTPSLEGARLAATTDNVHLELASSFAHLPTVRAVVAIAGLHKVMWGSDAPLLEPSFVLGTYRDAGLSAGGGMSDDALDRVFWGNAADLFGR